MPFFSLSICLSTCMSLQSDARDFTVSKGNFVQNTSNHYEWSSNFISVEFWSSIRYWYPPASSLGAAINPSEHYNCCCIPGTQKQYFQYQKWVTESVNTPLWISWWGDQLEWANRPLLKHVLRNWTLCSFCLPYRPQNWKQSWEIAWTSVKMKAYKQKSPRSSHFCCFVPC